MSHEIRTPMNGIMGLVDLTLQTVLNDTQRRYLELVRSSATSLLNIINDILDVSRIEAGRLRIECVPFTLPMLLDQVVAPLELRAREKGLALAVEVAPDVPGELLGDPLRMRQILVNLLGNAIKFTRRGSVRLNVSVQRRAGQPWLVASVIDTGVGIAADKLERIFEPFSQADASTTREFGGTGLGLTISRRLAHLMNGLLWAESTPGEGSVFHVKLPLAVPDNAAAGAGTTRPVLSTLHSGDTHWGDLAAAHGDDGGPQRVAELELPDDPPPGPGVLEVLVVDDLAMNRFLATTLVRTMGHRVTCAASGAEALRLHDERRFDLVLLDIQMPEMSGHEVAQRIRSRERERRVPYCPIVAMTAHAMPADRARSLACGMDDHLAKPVEKERLESVLQLLSRTGWRRSA
jgi:CheY-like chemotaxis protein